MKIKKDSYLRDSMFWYIVVITVIYFGMLIWGVARADDHDLSGNTYPIPKIETNLITDKTGDKVYEILDKMEKAETDNSVYHQKIVELDPKNTGGQYCFVKVIIKQKGDTIMKEEVLECADGRKKFDGPTYWQLFADFYYADVSTPEYCRYYSRPKHVFKSFGKTCLKKNGEWEVQ